MSNFHQKLWELCLRCNSILVTGWDISACMYDPAGNPKYSLSPRAIFAAASKYYFQAITIHFVVIAPTFEKSNSYATGQKQRSTSLLLRLYCGIAAI